MTFNRLLHIPTIILSLAGCLSAQPWSGIINSGRAIDWSQAGIPGGIPNRTTICATVDAASYGNGSTDATNAIQTALNNCAAQQVVQLTAGTFRINTGVSIPSNVTLRGQGASRTTLDARGSGAVVSFGKGSDPSIANSTAITGGGTAGSQSISLSSITGVAVGGYLMITELNDPTYVNITTNNGSCTWCDGGIGWNGTRVRGQIVEVTSVNGTTVGISPGLYSAYSRTPLATRITMGAKYAGAEDFKVYANNTGYSTNFLMRSTAYCWLKGVEGNFADADHVQAQWSYRGVIRDSYFHDGYVHSAGSSDNDLFIVNKTSGFLIENNITTRMHVSIMLNWGAAGNVIAYNYSEGAYDQSADNAILGDMSVHGAHPQFNLWEGNSFTSLYPDSVWGTSSHNTAFRNWWRGTSKICLPYSSRGTAGACHWGIQAVRAVQIAFTVSSFNSVGNVIGSTAMAGLKVYNGATAMQQTASIVNPSSRSYDASAYGYTWGYANLSDGGSSEGPGASYSSRFLHGDYNHTNASISWDSGASQALPASFYLASRPAWWGSTPYPAIGPDVSGGTDASGHANTNPAQACYDKTSKDTTGSLVFDRQACYGQTIVSAVAPASSLTVIAK